MGYSNDRSVNESLKLGISSYLEKTELDSFFIIVYSFSKYQVSYYVVITLCFSQDSPERQNQ